MVSAVRGAACRLKGTPAVSDRDDFGGFGSAGGDVTVKVPRGTSRLATHFQRQLDAERATLARELHDELGGLLVAAKMDLSHIERSLGAERPELRARIAQLQRNLDTAISAERRLVERLQPGLLVHVGLFAALRGYAEDLAAHTGGAYRALLPTQEAPLELPVRVALYRAAQEAIALGEGTAASPVQIKAVVRANLLTLAIEHSRAVDAPDEDLRVRVVLHRVRAVGGELAVETRPEGTTRLLLRLRLSPHADRANQK
jgi:two-component system sensor histidine kinase UhpB